jgi:hypothetical protein
MDSRHWKLCAAILIAFTLAACATKPGVKLVTYSEQTTDLPKPFKVTQAGSYGLYPDDGLTAIETLRLHPGDSIGFRHASDGTIVGFADDKEYKLSAVLATDYSWKLMGKEGEAEEK